MPSMSAAGQLSPAVHPYQTLQGHFAGAEEDIPEPSHPYPEWKNTPVRSNGKSSEFQSIR